MKEYVYVAFLESGVPLNFYKSTLVLATHFSLPLSEVRDLVVSGESFNFHSDRIYFKCVEIIDF